MGNCREFYSGHRGRQNFFPYAIKSAYCDYKQMQLDNTDSRTMATAAVATLKKVNSQQ